MRQWVVVFDAMRGRCSGCYGIMTGLWLVPARASAGPASTRATDFIMAASGFRGPKQIWNAFKWSMKGLRAGWRHEASFRLEACLAVVLIPLGLWLGHGPLEKIALVLPAVLVLSAELLNSAVEAVVDKVSPEFHELAGRAKDMGSAAVFLLLVMTVLSWTLILGERWLG
jgi:diacylglycerol kinase (ATP)